MAVAETIVAVHPLKRKLDKTRKEARCEAV